MKKLLLLFTFLYFSPHAVALEGSDYYEAYDELRELDEKVKKQWSDYENWQSDPRWVQEQSDLSLAGTVYAKGWLGPRVSRQIVPDFERGWLAVDTVSIGPSLLENLGVLGGNILLQQLIPYLQAGHINNKNFLNVRAYETYKEALLSKRFEFTRFPLTIDSIEDLEKGELFSTVTTGGFYTRAGGGIMNLIGLTLPAHLNLGPKAVVRMENSLKISIAKEDDEHVLVSIEDAKKAMNGVGIGFGVYFDDIIDVPVTVGINSRNGYSPITFNYKDEKEISHAAIFRINITTTEGQKAYKAFLQNDFTLLDDYADQDVSGVELEMYKDTETRTREWNFAIDLVIWRSGWRNIFSESNHQTIDGNGNEFEYMELTGSRISDRKRGSNFSRSSTEFSGLIPLRGEAQNHEEINSIDTFILDSNLMFSYSNISGSEIQDLSEDLVQLSSSLRIPVRVDPNRDYGAMSVDIRVRFTPQAIREILNASTEETWIAVASAIGMPDPFIWETMEQRRFYQSRFFDDRRINTQERHFRNARRIVNWLDRIRSLETNEDQAREMIRRLRNRSHGQLFHKTLLEICGINKVLTTGNITGQNLH